MRADLKFDALEFGSRAVERWGRSMVPRIIQSAQVGRPLTINRGLLQGVGPPTAQRALIPSR